MFWSAKSENVKFKACEVQKTMSLLL